MEHFVWNVQAYPPPQYFPMFISVMGACLFGDVGIHDWVIRFCQSSVQCPSWSGRLWGFLDVSGAQPQLCNTVVNLCHHRPK